ncbi:IS5/IS1182 family transposase, partial [Acinetobacter baumannii]|nr:IS5/IS1182 family transposase [Acinetobacter baumannii]
MNKPASKIYRTTNCSAYNRALINRGNISILLDP